MNSSDYLLSDKEPTTPTKGKGRPKGTPRKKGFKGIRRQEKLNTNIVSDNSGSRNIPVGLYNQSNDCFFNSVTQVLYSLHSFRDHVQHFTTYISNEVDAVMKMKTLFQDMNQSQETNHPIRTHECVQSLQMNAYVENCQFDAQECMTHIINLFYPRVDDINAPNRNMPPDNCLFRVDGGESMLCYNCDQQSNKPYRSNICQISIPDFETSIQREVEGLTSDEYGTLMEDLYQCEHCPQKTQASYSSTLWNVEKYMIVQLKIFEFNRDTLAYTKKIPNLFIEEEINNILLGILDLRAVVYHIGDSPFSGHYMSSVKYNETWYTTNDDKCYAGVQLHCSNNNDNVMTPYLLIYEKRGTSDSLIFSNGSETEYLSQNHASGNMTEITCDSLKINNLECVDVDNITPSAKNKASVIKELEF